MDVAASGNLPVNLGIGGAGLDLTGTTASADVDLKAPAAHATFDAPGLLGVRGELIAVDGKTYVKTSLTGPQFREGSTDGLPGASGVPALPSAGASGEAAAMLQQLEAFLSKPGVDPALGADAPCGTATCYTVEIELTPAEIAALQTETGMELPTASLPVDVGDLSQAGVDLTFHVDQGHEQAVRPDRRRRSRSGRQRGPGREQRSGLDPEARRDVLEVGRAGHDHRPAGRPDRARQLTAGLIRTARVSRRT